MNSLFGLDRHDLLGRPAPYVYRCVLLAQHDAAVATICRYASPPSLQRRVHMTDYEESIVDAALVIRERDKLPFWEAVFCAAIQSGECRDTLLDASLYHGGLGDLTECSREAIENGVLEEAVEGGARNVGLSSKVRMSSGECRHLMFLDFHSEVSDRNVELVHRVCRRLIPSGFVIFDSGDSYHAASLALGTSEDRIRFLGRALLVAPIVDPTYIAHQLQQDASSIRISRGGKREQFPTAVDVYLPPHATAT